MSGVFISYRRSDSRHAAGRLFDRLERDFDRSKLFMDVDGIEPGLDFVEVLNERVGACEIVLAVIGPNWLTAEDSRGRRLDHEDDFVRIELEAALARKIRVVPVLVDGARMPGSDELPESLRSLARRQAISLSHERFMADADAISEVVGRVLEAQPAPPQAQIPMRKSAGSGAPSEADVRLAFQSAPRSDVFHLAPAIPPNLLANARKKTRAPEGEEAVALVDLTVFKNANDQILFTTWGMRQHYLGDIRQKSWAEVARINDIHRHAGLGGEFKLDGELWNATITDRDYVMNLIAHLRDALA